MYCANCGKEISNQAYICPHCGRFTSKAVNSKPSTTNGMAIAGFVCSFFIPLLGFIFGGIGYAKSKELNGAGYQLSSWAIVISIVSTILTITMFASGMV